MSEYDIAKSSQNSSIITPSVMTESDQNHHQLLHTRESVSEEENVMFLKMKLAKGISKFNIVSFFLLAFVNFCGLNMALGFLSFLLRDKNYYNVPSEKVGSVNSEVSKDAEIVLIVIGFFIGPIFDLVGRKKIIILGQIMSGAAYLLFP